MTRTTRGVLVLAATPIGDPRDAAAAAGGRARRRPTSSRPRTPAGCAGWPRPRRRAGRAGCVSYHEHNEAARTAELVEPPAAGRRVRASSPTPACRRSPTPGYRLVARRGRGRACASPACPGRAPCSRRSPSPACPSTGSASRASCRARRGSGRARCAALAAERAHDGVLRGAAPARGDARRDGRGVRRRPAGGGLPRADQDLRGGPARPLAELAAWAAGGVRGEITVVVAGRPGAAGGPDVADAVARHPERVARRGAAQGRGAPTSRRPQVRRRRRSTTRRSPPVRRGRRADPCCWPPPGVGWRTGPPTRPNRAC